MKIAILDDYCDTARTLPCFETLKGHDVTVWTDRAPPLDLIAQRLKDAEALVMIRERTKMTADLIARLPNLRFISHRGAYPHIDIAACTRAGVVVSSNMQVGAPSYATAELTFALILAGLRRLPQEVAALKQGRFQVAIGRNARGRTLGVFGYGRIGAVVADYARAFGMKVVVHGREASRAAAERDGFAFEPNRAAFFANCDVVSLHVRLNSQTRGMVGTEDLARMRPDALIVNTSRAGLIAPGALVAALDSGRPGMAAMDVFETEPLCDPNDPLLARDDVIATPHIGYVTQEDLTIQFSDMFEQIVAYAAGAPIHVVNPEALKG